ncbi:MAG: flagellar M-ring protein FliF [Curvibacter sp.]|nr:flagellar M-ring protein FliF [Curvibacter sp.]
MFEIWNTLSKGAKLRFGLGAFVVLLALGASSYWVLRPDYQLLFSDLKPQDAAAMEAELDKLKIAYRADEDAGVIWVDKAQVHATRIKLMAMDLPLRGAVGFELFNSTDFGMTEFAQKINYQRALQGELTRTILSLSEVKDVRVHLALPEQGLFKQATAHPKAAITLSLRDGQTLRPEQVNGIQRLVAAATPGLTPEDVTVVDIQGVALSRMADEAGDNHGSSIGTAGGNGRLELKSETEQQLARKASAILDRTFGVGQALVSVDVSLNMDQVKTTTEDILPAPSKGVDSKGVIVKERESLHDANVAPLDAPRTSGAAGAGSTQREVEYQVGRRVEQVSSAAGSVRRIQLVAVVKRAMSAAQQDQLRQVLAAAVGASVERGDNVVVQSIQALADQPKSADVSAGAEPSLDAEGRSNVNPSVRQSEKPTSAASMSWPQTLILLLVLVLAFALWLLFNRRKKGEAVRLTEQDRQQVLSQLKRWLDDGSPNGAAKPTVPRSGGSAA